MVAVFWLSVFGVLYPYIGYPAVMWIVGRLNPRRGGGGARNGVLPSISMIIPVHNEAVRLGRKIANTAALRYPADRLQVLFVSDGSTDQTVEILRGSALSGMTVVELPARAGKAAALNAGVRLATNDILVFSDASIELESEALNNIVRQFQDPAIGCVSGEDRIPESGGEAWYGRYELFLRQLESQVHSIVGASGSFYAQRRALCAPFTEGMAPDFLSVLRTVEQGYRAISEETAIGVMTSVKDPRREFERKVRTSIRGLTTLFAYGHLLNPLRFGGFAFALWSHKVMRWLAPLFMLGALLSSLALIESPWYLTAFLAQIAFYFCALAALNAWFGFEERLVGRISLYFLIVNAAVLAGWWQYGRGVRQELWAPSQR